AEDGIRDDLVTGVQTCALPIFGADLPAGLPSIPTAIGTALVTGMAADRAGWAIIAAEFASLPTAIGAGLITGMAANRTGWAIIRSEERRVGKERGEGSDRK